MERTLIKEILQGKQKEVEIKGWVQGNEVMQVIKKLLG
jgi:hypothetical protein